jgi:hypothetical protein
MMELAGFLFDGRGNASLPLSEMKWPDESDVAYFAAA